MRGGESEKESGEREKGERNPNQRLDDTPGEMRFKTQIEALWGHADKNFKKKWAKGKDFDC
jgi:hypothetical protein